MSDIVACLALSVLPVTAIFWDNNNCNNNNDERQQDPATTRSTALAYLFNCHPELVHYEELIQCVNCTSAVSSSPMDASFHSDDARTGTENYSNHPTGSPSEDILS